MNKKPSIKGQGVNIFLPNQTEEQKKLNEHSKISKISEKTQNEKEEITSIPQTYMIQSDVLQEFENVYQEIRKKYRFIKKSHLVNIALKLLFEQHKNNTLKLF